MFDLPRVLVVIVAVLVALQVVRDRLAPGDDDLVLALFAFIPDRFVLEAGEPAYPGGWGALGWTFLSHALLHGSWMHLLLNAAMLAAVGRVVVRRIGTGRFLALAGVSAIGGASAHLLAEWGSGAPMIGASGVVFGVIGAALRFVFMPLWLPLPSAIAALRVARVRSFIGALVVMNVLLVVLGTAPFGGGDDSSVAWAAHLGGFLAGFLGFSLVDPPRRA